MSRLKVKLLIIVVNKYEFPDGHSGWPSSSISILRSEAFVQMISLRFVLSSRNQFGLHLDVLG